MSNERRDLFGTNIPDNVLSRPSAGKTGDAPGIESKKVLVPAVIGAIMSLGMVFAGVKGLKAMKPPQPSANSVPHNIQPEKYNDLDR